MRTLCHLYPVRTGRRFLGQVVFPSNRRLAADNVRRLRKWLKRWKKMPPENLTACLAAWQGHAQQANTWALLRTVERDLRQTRGLAWSGGMGQSGWVGFATTQSVVARREAWRRAAGFDMLGMAQSGRVRYATTRSVVARRERLVGCATTQSVVARKSNWPRGSEKKQLAAW